MSAVKVRPVDGRRMDREKGNAPMKLTGGLVIGERSQPRGKDLNDPTYLIVQSLI